MLSAAQRALTWRRISYCPNKLEDRGDFRVAYTYVLLKKGTGRKKTLAGEFECGWRQILTGKDKKRAVGLSFTADREK